MIACYSIIGKWGYDETITSGRNTLIIIEALTCGLEAGILEEMLFRGYYMNLLAAKWNKYVAIIVPSFVFSLLHIPSMEKFDFISFVLLICAGTLVGIMFSVIAYTNKSIWNSALFHSLWNAIMIYNILHVRFADEESINSIFTITVESRNPLVTGAGFGLEASIFSILAYIIIILIYTKVIKKKSI